MTGLTPPPVRWSKRIRIDRCQRSAIDRRCIETASRKFEHGYDLLAGHVEPVHDLVYRGARLEVFKTVETGIRVSLKTQAPPRLPGTLSTAAHCDQSRTAMVRCPCFQDTSGFSIELGY